MASCEGDDDFNVLGDGDGDGDADGEGQEEAKASSKGKGNKREKRKDLHLPLDAFSLNKKHQKEKEEEETERGHSNSNSKRGSADVYRKDREEWSDGAIEALLDAYSHRFDLLNRGNLRGRDWEDVAAAVNLTLNPSATDTANTGINNRKTVEQCKNKIDNLKKRFKVECHRLTSTSSTSSHWPWFSKLHLIVSNPSSSSHHHSRSQTSSPLALPILHPSPGNVNDDDSSPSPSASASVAAPPASLSASGRHSKRYGVAALAQAAMHISPAPRYKWKRVLLKVSGVALMATSASGPQNVDPKVVMLLAREIQVASRQGIQVAVVVGGRNIFCGESWIGATAVDRAATYQIWRSLSHTLGEKLSAISTKGGSSFLVASLLASVIPSSPLMQLLPLELQKSMQMLSSKVLLEMLYMAVMQEATIAQALSTSHTGSSFLEASLPWTPLPLLFVKRITFLLFCLICWNPVTSQELLLGIKLVC